MSAPALQLLEELRPRGIGLRLRDIELRAAGDQVAFRPCAAMTPGNVIDYEVIRRRINEIGERFKIRKIAIDPWNATQFSIQLQGDGFEVVT